MAEEKRVDKEVALSAASTPETYELDISALLEAADYLHRRGGGPIEDRLRFLADQLRLRLVEDQLATNTATNKVTANTEALQNLAARLAADEEAWSRYDSANWTRKQMVEHLAAIVAAYMPAPTAHEMAITYARIIVNDPIGPPSVPSAAMVIQRALEDFAANKDAELVALHKYTDGLLQACLDAAGPDWAGNEVLTIRALRAEVAKLKDAAYTIDTLKLFADSLGIEITIGTDPEWKVLKPEFWRNKRAEAAETRIVALKQAVEKCLHELKWLSGAFHKGKTEDEQRQLSPARQLAETELAVVEEHHE